MMNLKENIRHTKLLVNEGIDLLLLRMQLLNLDLAAQAGNAVRSIVWLVVAAILLLVGFISLMFGLNRALTDQQALWVFFGIAAFSVLFVVITYFRVVGSWKKQNNLIGSTLRDIQADIAYLRGNIDEE